MSLVPAAPRRGSDRDVPQHPADKALRALGPAHPATCPHGFAAPSPGCWQGRPTSASTPATPARGYAARGAGPECTDVLENRKRRPDAASGSDRVGAVELCSPKPVAGGFGEAEREGASVASGCGGEGAGLEVPEGGSEGNGVAGGVPKGGANPFRVPITIVGRRRFGGLGRDPARSRRVGRSKPASWL